MIESKMKVVAKPSEGTTTPKGKTNNADSVLTDAPKYTPYMPVDAKEVAGAHEKAAKQQCGDAGNWPRMSMIDRDKNNVRDQVTECDCSDSK